MRIIVLGGAGDMGAEAVKDLVQNPQVQAVTIADLNVQAAQNLARKLNTEKVQVSQVDATSSDELVKVLVGHDVAAGALGPFYQFEKPIMEAALKAGVDYVSICDDHDAVASVLPLDEKARKQGRRFLTGMGWAPGLSNIVARQGYNELDQVDDISIYWAGSAADAVGLAIILHTLHIFSGDVACFRDGRVITIPAGSGKEKVRFPDPLHDVWTFHLGHPEPITMPQYLPDIGGVCIKGGLVENYINSFARFLNGLGITRSPRRKAILGELMKTLLPLMPLNKKRAYCGIWVDVKGQKNGQPLQISFGAVDRIRRLTGISLSIGSFLMGNGHIQRHGVFAPEADGAIEPQIYIAELEKRGIKVHREDIPLENTVTDQKE